MSMSVAPKIYFTSEEYLAIERMADYKSEYFNGEMFAMAGASPTHALIVTNVVSELRTQLKKRPCTVYSTDLRLRVSPTGLYTYPDVAVVCGEPEYDDKYEDTLLNPTLIIEVLSESTESYDRGAKFKQYQSVKSVKEYVLIAQNTPRIERFTRQNRSRWSPLMASHIGDEIELSSVNCVLSLAEVYDKVRF